MKPAPKIQVHAFTQKCDQRARTLINEVHIFRDNPSIIRDACRNTYRALWDTGATGTVISSKVVEQCDLLPIGVKTTHTANGQRLCNEYLISLILPNKILVPDIRVIDATLFGFDVLIGMDVITLGDFAITNFEGRSTFSFRIPSIECIDFAPNELPPEKRLLPDAT